MSLGGLSRAKLPPEATLLVKSVRAFLVQLDVEMQGPSTFDRGVNIGKLAAGLEYAVDSFEHFGMPSWEKRLIKRGKPMRVKP